MDRLIPGGVDGGRRRQLRVCAWPPRLQASDVIAGASVAVVLVPQSLAYAQLAGFPPSRGLFAASIPAIVAAPLASSPYLQPGPTAVTALLTYSALAPLAPIGSAHYMALGLLLALLVGLIRVAVGVLRAGIVAYLVSQPLLIGFVPAAAILIAASQVPVALGVHAHGQNQLYRLGTALSHPSDLRVDAVLVASVVAVILLIGKRLHPLFPGVLVAVAGAIVYSRLAGYDGLRLGAISTGFPPLTRSLPLGDVPRLIVPSLVIALLGFIEASSIARTYAAQERTRWDADREFVSQGIGNLAAGAFGGFPVGASFSRSALNRLAGAKTNISGLVTGCSVLLFLPLGFLLAPLPQSVLAAIVIVAVVPLIRLDRIVDVARLSRPQLTITLSAFILTIALAPHLEWAILSAIALSICIHLWRELRLDLTSTGDGERLLLMPEGVLWFGTARRLEDCFLSLLEAHPRTRLLTIRLDRLGRIDLTGALVLKDLISDARSAGLEVEVRGSPAHAARVLRRVLGEDA